MRKSAINACNGGTKGGVYVQHWHVAPIVDKTPLLPKNMNKPFLQRLKEWIKG